MIQSTNLNHLAEAVLLSPPAIHSESERQHHFSIAKELYSAYSIDNQIIQTEELITWKWLGW